MRRSVSAFALVGVLITAATPDVAAATNRPPVASFTINKTTGWTPMKVHVDASASRDSDGRIKSYRFNWGDGTYDTLTKIADHTYRRHARFTLKLTVTDNSGAKASASKVITVA